MKRTLCLLLLLTVGISTPSFAQSSVPPYDWVIQSSGNAAALGTSIATDAAGNSYIAGNFTGTINFGTFTLTGSGAQADMFLAKLDASGNFIWATSVTGANGGPSKIVDISLDATGNCYVAGIFYGTAVFGNTTLTSLGGDDMFAAKFDSDGNPIWAKRIGENGYDYDGVQIAADASGCYFAGSFSDTLILDSYEFVTTPGTGLDLFLTRLDANGDVVWAKHAEGTPGSIFASGMTIDASGNCYLTGSFFGTANFDNITLAGFGNNDVFIAKIDTDGNFLWVTEAGGNQLDVVADIAVDASGNSYTTGTFMGSPVFGSTTLSAFAGGFIAKTDANGNFLWAKQVSGSVFPQGMAMDALGNSLITGSFFGTVTFGNATFSSPDEHDNFFIKLDNNGNFQWAKQAGDTSMDAGMGISADASGNAYAIGIFGGAPMFDSITLSRPSAGSYVYVTKIKSGTLDVKDLDEKSALHIFPNPAGRQFTISGLSGKSTVSIFGFNGQMLLEKSGNREELTINTEGWASGTYLIRITNEREVINRKLIISN